MLYFIGDFFSVILYVEAVAQREMKKGKKHIFLNPLETNVFYFLHAV